MRTITSLKIVLSANILKIMANVLKIMANLSPRIQNNSIVEFKLAMIYAHAVFGVSPVCLMYLILGKAAR